MHVQFHRFDSSRISVLSFKERGERQSKNAYVICGNVAIDALAAPRPPNPTCTQADADIVDLAAVTER
jgi:hypothetical protein